MGQVSDPDLAALYADAVVMVSASTVEGFGLPVLEAAAIGSLWPAAAYLHTLKQLEPSHRCSIRVTRRDADANRAAAGSTRRCAARPWRRVSEAFSWREWPRT